jgi:hypothetical protein
MQAKTSIRFRKFMCGEREQRAVNIGIAASGAGR